VPLSERIGRTQCQTCVSMGEGKELLARRGGEGGWSTRAKKGKGKGEETLTKTALAGTGGERFISMKERGERERDIIRSNRRKSKDGEKRSGGAAIDRKEKRRSAILEKVGSARRKGIARERVNNRSMRRRGVTDVVITRKKGRSSA